MSNANEMKKYIFVGCAQGCFDAEDRQTGQKFKKDYFNAYLISPVSDYKSAEYSASGFKAEKFSCLNADVWKDIMPGEEVNLFFGEKSVIALMTSTGRSVVLAAE